MQLSYITAVEVIARRHSVEICQNRIDYVKINISLTFKSYNSWLFQFSFVSLQLTRYYTYPSEYGRNK